MPWIVVPTYNESANLPELLQRIAASSPESQVLVVDDASPDGTAAVARGLMRQYPQLQVLERVGKLGLGSAYRAGFAYALEHGARIVGEMDADLSHAPEDLPRLYAALVGGAQVVIGSRRVLGGHVVGWGPWRHFTSWGANGVSRLVLGLTTRDVTAGYRLYTAAALAQIPWREVTSDGYAWQEELLYLLERAQVHIAEVPVTFVDRTRGQSKLGISQVLDFFITLARLKFGK